MKAKENGRNQYGIYRSLMIRDKQCRAGQCLFREMGKVQTGLTHVEVNTTTGKEEMTEKEYVEYSCNDDNRGKYS